MTQLDFTRKELEQLLPYITEYDRFRIPPEQSTVQKGDILRATHLADSDPTFRGAEILVLGYDNQGTVIGTSFRRDHPAYLVQARWDINQLESEMKVGVWNKTGSLDGNIMDYFAHVNARA